MKEINKELNAVVNEVNFKSIIKVFFLQIILAGTLQAMDDQKQKAETAAQGAIATAAADQNLFNTIAAGDAQIIKTRCEALYCSVLFAENIEKENSYDQVVVDFAKGNAIKALSRVIEFYYERKISLDAFIRIESQKVGFSKGGINTSIRDLALRVLRLYDKTAKVNLESSITRLYKDLESRNQALANAEYVADLIRARRVNEAKQFISTVKIDFALFDSMGYPLIFYPAFYGDKEVINSLLKAGATVNQKHISGVLIPFMIVPNLGTIEFLISLDANIEDIDKNGSSVLSKAVEHCDLGAVEKIVLLTAKIYQRSSAQTKPALFIAIDLVDLKLVDALLSTGVKLDETFDGDMAYKYAQKKLGSSKNETLKTIVERLQAASRPVIAAIAAKKFEEAEKEKRKEKERAKNERLQLQEKARLVRLKKEKKLKKELLLAQQKEDKEKELARVELEKRKKEKEAEEVEKKRKEEKAQKDAAEMKECAEKEITAKAKREKEEREAAKKKAKTDRRAQKKLEKEKTEKEQLEARKILEAKEETEIQVVVQRLVNSTIHEALINIELDNRVAIFQAARNKKIKQKVLNALNTHAKSNQERLSVAQIVSKKYSQWKLLQSWKSAFRRSKDNKKKAYDEELSQWTMQKAKFLFDTHEYAHLPKESGHSASLTDAEKEKTVDKGDYFRWLNDHIEGQIFDSCSAYLVSKSTYKPSLPPMRVNCRLCELYLNKQLLVRTVQDLHWSDFKQSGKYQVMSHRVKMEALKKQRTQIEEITASKSRSNAAVSQNMNGTNN
jgi:hypothetical protein